MKSAPELSIAIPFYNEEGNVKAVIKGISSELKNSKINHEIVAVNNGSNDRTQDIIKKFAEKNKNIKMVNIAKNTGYGNGIISGLNNCTGKYIGFCWGDNEVKAKHIVEIYKKMKREDLDICKATRTTKNYKAFRKFLSYFYNKGFCIMFNLHSNDINGCPKIMKKEIYKKIKPQSKDWFIDAEIMIKAHKYGLKTGEIPVSYEKRKSGKSSVKFSTVFEFIKNAVKFKLR